MGALRCTFRAGLQAAVRAATRATNAHRSSGSRADVPVGYYSTKLDASVDRPTSCLQLHPELCRLRPPR
jgi:hypothetical protein